MYTAATVSQCSFLAFVCFFGKLRPLTPAPVYFLHSMEKATDATELPRNETSARFAQVSGVPFKGRMPFSSCI